MSKTIKVSDETKEKLEEIQRPRETFDDVVTRLLFAHHIAGQLLNAMEGSINFQERQREKLEKTTVPQ